MTLITSTSLVSSYFILKSNYSKFAFTTYNIRPELLGLYKNTYMKESREETSKNIIIVSVIFSLTAAAGYIFFIENLGLNLDGNFYFGP